MTATESEADNLDDFLDFLENGDDTEGDGTGQVQNTRGNENHTENGIATTQPRKALKDLTYEDVFGSPSPQKKKRKKSDAYESNSNQISGRSVLAPTKAESCSKNSMSQLGSRPVEPTLIKSLSCSGGLDTTQLILDHHSRIRLYKTSIELYHDGSTSLESMLRERNFGLQYVNLLAFEAWYRLKGTEQKNFWVSGVLARKQPGVRKSAKGNEYAIWEINDLKQVDKCWTVFLFSSAATSSDLGIIPIGSLIDITTPSVLDSKSGPPKLSVNNSTQIRRIGTAKDFGFCQSKRKDGKDCTAVVNTWECCTCIHHAASELKKLNGKKRGGKPVVSFGKGTNFDRPPQKDSNSKAEGVFTVNFGRRPKQPTSKTNFNINQNSPNITNSLPGVSLARMELQGTSVCNELKRNSLSIGNASSISFKKEANEFLEKVPAKPANVQRLINLDPFKTRHLTEKDRMILAALSSPTKSKSLSSSDKNSKKERGKSTFSTEIASRIVSNPTAGSRNFLRYLTGNEEKSGDRKKSDPHDTSRKEAEPITVTRETIRNMKKALDFVKQNGPIKKVDPNNVSKRKSVPADFKAGGETRATSSIAGPSRVNPKKRQIEVEFDFESEDFKKILNAKSAHDDHLNDLKEGEYFDKLVKKEAIENKLQNTFSIATNAVMCKQCKYVALGQSEFCKGLQHPIRVVKATKRFFKCKDCGNRTMSLDRLPKHPCKQCNSSCWLAAPVGKEKKGPILPTEVLSVRGNEEKFIGASGSKMFLSLEV